MNCEDSLIGTSNQDFLTEFYKKIKSVAKEEGTSVFVPGFFKTSLNIGVNKCWQTSGVQDLLKGFRIHPPFQKFLDLPLMLDMEQSIILAINGEIPKVSLLKHMTGTSTIL